MAQNECAVSEYPMQRSLDSPLDPPPELLRVLDNGHPTKVRIWDGSTPWLVTRYDHQRLALADSRLSSDVTLTGFPHSSAARSTVKLRSPTFASMDDPDHAKYRRMLMGSFAVKTVEKLRPRVQFIVDQLIHEMLGDGDVIDFVEYFALPVPSLVICELLGIPYEDHAFFQRCSHSLTSRSANESEATAATDELKVYLLSLLDSKEQEPADDLLSRLVSNQVRSGDLSRSELADIALLLLVAGHETTANMIALGTLAWLRNPQQCDLLRSTDDPNLIANAVEELLRYLTISHLGRRRIALQDFDLGGVLIRAGEGIILANDAGNRDETAFPDPACLDPRRAARHHLAFSYGIHQCLGQSLSRMELQVVFGTLFKAIPTLRLAVDFETLRFRSDMSAYGVVELPVTWGDDGISQ